MKKVFCLLCLPLMILQSCQSPETSFQPNENKVYIKTAHNFSKRNSTISSNKNSVNIQKDKQIQLNTTYFKAYSSGKEFYISTDTNAHLQLLNKASTSLGIKIDTNNDSKITFEEIKAFVTNDAYIKYFRTNYISPSFKKLDSDSNLTLSADEYYEFNSKIKDHALPDFQLLEEFEEFDYNSDRSLSIDEYEDFYMDYLIAKLNHSK